MISNIAAKKNKITIITPCLNAMDLLKDTVLSVLSQKAVLENNVELEYIICDGGSTDGSRQWIESLNSPLVHLISESDNGIYDGLVKGLQIASGEIIGYLNAGDYYSPYAFNILKDVFSNANVKWVTGFNVCYNNEGFLISVNLPGRYRRRFIKKGMYGSFLPWIQQESTFWRLELNSLIDLKTLSRFKLAGDYYLWNCFAEQTDLKIVKAYLCGFREHIEQLSENKALYKSELLKISGQRPNAFDYVQAFFDYMIWWFLPDRLKLIMNTDIIQL
ncbi:MAG: glycosyltransferase [Desulfobacteraceae bacterium]|nr:glycosyltransferase [Desulfobacteraceae bacterium]MBC2756763.1 glycosyltransferase [Desulfobacteraceae bacterium]